MAAREKAAKPGLSGKEVIKGVVDRLSDYGAAGLKGKLQATPAKSKKSKRRDIGNVVYL